MTEPMNGPDGPPDGLTGYFESLVAQMNQGLENGDLLGYYYLMRGAAGEMGSRMAEVECEPHYDNAFGVLSDGLRQISSDKIPSIADNIPDSVADSIASETQALAEVSDAYRGYFFAESHGSGLGYELGTALAKLDSPKAATILISQGRELPDDTKTLLEHLYAAYSPKLISVSRKLGQTMVQGETAPTPEEIRVAVSATLLGGSLFSGQVTAVLGGYDSEFADHHPWKGRQKRMKQGISTAIHKMTEASPPLITTSSERKPAGVLSLTGFGRDQIVAHLRAPR